MSDSSGVVTKKALAKARTAYENARTAAINALLFTDAVPRDLLSPFAALASAPLSAGAGPVRVTFTAPGMASSATREDNGIMKNATMEAWTPELEAWALDLTRRNMRQLYDGTGDKRWAWSDSRKRSELFDTDTRFLVARITDEALPAAFLAFRLLVEGGAEVLYVYELQAEANVRRKGVGRRLMQLAELIARRHLLQAVMLTVLKDNSAAVAFYTQKLGYAPDASSPSSCGDDDAPHEILSKAAHAGAARTKALIDESFAAGRLPADLLMHEHAWAR